MKISDAILAVIDTAGGTAPPWLFAEGIKRLVDLGHIKVEWQAEGPLLILTDKGQKYIRERGII